MKKYLASRTNVSCVKKIYMTRDKFMFHASSILGRYDIENQKYIGRMEKTSKNYFQLQIYHIFEPISSILFRR